MSQRKAWSSKTCPRPDLGKGAIRIGVRACGVDYPDNLMIAGKYQVQPPLPFSPGFELAGEILELGEGVTHLRAGPRVAAPERLINCRRLLGHFPRA